MTTYDGADLHERFEDEKDPVYGPGLGTGVCTFIDKTSQVTRKVAPALFCIRCWELTIVVCSTNPHVPHEKREADHQSGGPERSAELELVGFAIVVFGLRIDVLQ